MDKILIKKYLELLGINSIENLESKDIDYWWLLKFKQIQSDDKVSAEGKQRYLIKINNAKDNLSEIDISELKKILLNNNSNKANSNNYGKPRNEKRNYKNDESNVEDNSSGNKEYKSEEQSSNRILGLILIISSFVITIGYFIANNDRQYNRILTEDDFSSVPINSNDETVYYSNGKYVGRRENGKRNGYGTYYYSDGNRYEGYWLESEKHGKGSFYWSNGDRYVGYWLESEKHGKGSFYWSNGDRYVGEYLNGNRTGYGIYYWNDGSRYEGYWLDSKRNGYGTYTGSSGYTERQYWRNGTRIE